MVHLAILGIALALTGAPDAPFQELTLDQALTNARAEKKVVLIDFFTTWCAPCKQMDARTWKDPIVHEWIAKNAIAIKLDAERERELAQRYAVKAYPSMLIVKPDGVERDRLVGFIEPGVFVAEMDVIARGEGRVERARVQLAGHENEPMLRLELGRALEIRGRLDEALAEFVWCFDKSPRGAGFSDVQRASLCTDLARLGELLPLAAQAFEERRTAAESALLAGKGTPDIARDFSAMNRARDDAKRTADMFRQLTADGRLSVEVKEALLDDVVAGWMLDRQYALVVEAIGDAEARLQQRVATIDRARQRDPATRAPRDQDVATLVSQTVEQGGVYYEALLGAQKTDIAARVADQILKLQPSGVTFVGLIGRAVRADAPDTARALAERAYTTLTEREQKLVRIAARRIPAKQ